MKTDGCMISALISNNDFLIDLAKFIQIHIRDRFDKLEELED